METPEQYTVKTPEKFTIVGSTETTILNEDGQVIFDASCLEHTGLTDWKYSKKITALFASVPELIKENERLRGTIGVECVKQLLAAREANVEMLKMLTEVIQFDYNHLLSERVSALTADLSEKIKSVITKYSKP